MPKEPENIVHPLLRDIRAKQDEHFARIDKLFSQLEKLLTAEKPE